MESDCALWRGRGVLTYFVFGPMAPFHRVMAHVFSAPPVVDIRVVFGRSTVVMQHRAQPAEELGVDKLAGALPQEVLVVQLVVRVQPVQVLGQPPRRFVIVHVQVRPLRHHPLVILPASSHRDRQHVMPSYQKKKKK